MNENKDFGAKLKAETICVRLDISRCGTSKAFTGEQNQRTAEAFSARAKRVKGRRQVIDDSHQAWRKVAGILNAAKGYWRSLTLPIPDEPGKRLLKKSAVEKFDEAMTRMQDDLSDAKDELRSCESEIIALAREELCDLWEEGLVSEGLADEFGLTWGYSEENPPEYLEKLNPELFKREQERVRALFDAAALEATPQLTDELHKMVADMVERLQPGENGKPKVFRDSLVGNVKDFFDRFSFLNVGNSADLEEAVARCKAVLTSDGQELTPERIRKDVNLRTAIASEMEQVKAKLDTMVVERPKRRIRFKQEETE
jgi:hypothetical protein